MSHKKRNPVGFLLCIKGNQLKFTLISLKDFLSQ